MTYYPPSGGQRKTSAKRLAAARWVAGPNPPEEIEPLEALSMSSPPIDDEAAASSATTHGVTTDRPAAAAL